MESFGIIITLQSSSPAQGKGTGLLSANIPSWASGCPNPELKVGLRVDCHGVCWGPEPREDGSVGPGAEHLQGSLGCRFNHHPTHQIAQRAWATFSLR